MSPVKSKSTSEILEGFEKILSVYLKGEEKEEFRNYIAADTYKIIETQLAYKPKSNGKPPKESFFTEVIRRHLDRIISYTNQKLSEPNYLALLTDIGEHSLNMGEFSLAGEIFEQIILLAKKDKAYDSVYAYSLLSFANLYSRQAVWEEAKKYLRKAANVFKRSNDIVGLSKCENLFGTIYAEQGRLKNASSHFEKGMALLNPDQHNSHIAMFEVNLGILYNMSGNLDLSLAHFQRALLKYEELNDFQRTAEVRHNLGMLYMKKGQFDSALAEFEISIEISLRHRLLPVLVISYLGTGESYILVNDLELAQAYVDKGFELAYQVNDKLSLAEAYKLRGSLLRIMGQYQAAENELTTSYRMNKQLDNNLNAAETAIELGILYQEMKDQRSSEYFDLAYNYFKRIKNPLEIKKIKSVKK